MSDAHVSSRRHQTHIDNVLDQAGAIARRLDNPAVGCEHILLYFLVEHQNEVGMLLRDYGVSSSNFVSALQGCHELPDRAGVPVGDMRCSALLTNVVARVRRYAAARECLFIPSLIWLDAVLRQAPGTPALTAFNQLWINRKRLQLEVRVDLYRMQAGSTPIPRSRSAEHERRSQTLRRFRGRVVLQV